MDRRLLDADRRITPAGSGLLEEAERLTNRLALGPLAQLDDEQLRQVGTKLLPVARATSTLFPQPNPIGMPESWNPGTDPEATAIAQSPTG
jgi:hypothetical protein